MNAFALRRRQRGFTLIEAIAVIVIMGILGTFIAMFVQMQARSYLNSAARAAASDMADNTMRRLARDLRLALPNSVRVNSPANNYIEYIETKAGLRYLAEDDVGAAPTDPYLNWNDASELQFTVVGGVPGGRHAPVTGDSVVVYNLGPDQKPGDAYDCDAPVQCNRALITGLTATSITMGSNPFALQSTPLMSPGKRFYVVASPVTYGCANRQLVRYWNYNFNALQQAPPVGAFRSAVLADNVESCVFSYTSLANLRGGIIGITLTFSAQDGSAPMTLLHQIHVDNTP